MEFNWEDFEVFKRDEFSITKCPYVASLNDRGQLFINNKWLNVGFDVSLKYALAYSRDLQIIGLKPSTETHAVKVMKHAKDTYYIRLAAFMKHFQIAYPKKFRDAVQEDGYWILKLNEDAV
jgi:hypothetical protein